MKPTDKKTNTTRADKAILTLSLALSCLVAADLVTSAERTQDIMRKMNSLQEQRDYLRTMISISDTLITRYNSTAARKAARDASYELQKIDSAYNRAVMEYDANKMYLQRIIDKIQSKEK